MEEQHVEDGALQIVEGRKPGIKLQPGPPHLVICVPIGTKDLLEELQVPKVGEGSGEGCNDPNCQCKNHGMFIRGHSRGKMMVPAQWALNYANLTHPLNCRTVCIYRTGQLSAKARNSMTKQAIEMGAKYIFYWDDDVIIPNLMLYEMHQILETHEDIGLITGVYTTKENPPEPVLYKKQGEGAWWGFSIDPEMPPEDIYAAGGGCIMARVEDIKKMQEPYWHDEMILHPGNPRHPYTIWGHDIRFIKNFREQTGKRTVVKGSLLCGHWNAAEGKTYTLPVNSPPYKRLGNEFMNHELVQFGVFDDDVVRLALQDSEMQQRIFMVEKDIPQEKIQTTLDRYFDKVSIATIDGFWVAVCEGLKQNGNRGTEGHTVCEGCTGDVCGCADGSGGQEVVRPEGCGSTCAGAGSSADEGLETETGRPGTGREPAGEVHGRDRSVVI